MLPPAAGRQLLGQPAGPRSPRAAMPCCIRPRDLTRTTAWVGWLSTPSLLPLQWWQVMPRRGPTWPLGSVPSWMLATISWCTRCAHTSSATWSPPASRCSLPPRDGPSAGPPGNARTPEAGDSRPSWWRPTPGLRRTGTASSWTRACRRLDPRGPQSVRAPGAPGGSPSELAGFPGRRTHTWTPESLVVCRP